MRRLLDKLRRYDRERRADRNWPWFRSGYLAALSDINRTGLTPISRKAREESAHRAIERWVEDGAL